MQLQHCSRQLHMHSDLDCSVEICLSARRVREMTSDLQLCLDCCCAGDRRSVSEAAVSSHRGDGAHGHCCGQKCHWPPGAGHHASCPQGAPTNSPLPLSWHHRDNASMLWLPLLLGCLLNISIKQGSHGFVNLYHALHTTVGMQDGSSVAL